MIVIIEHQCLRSVDSCLEQAHCLWILKFLNPILDKFFTSPILSIQQTLDFLSLLVSTLLIFVVRHLEPEDWKDDVTDSLQLLHRLDPERV